jgi:hypothetical protein
VQVAEGAAVLGTALAGATGSWSYPAVLANGAHALHALATDAAGNVSGPSPTVYVRVDSVKPSAPTLVVATPTNADPVPVSGTADAGTVVRVYEETLERASAVADAANRWSAALQGLGPGAHALRAVATSATGVASDPASATVVVDRAGPAVASRTPGNGASNVWSRDAIVVTFTEPIAAPPPGVSPASLMTQDGTAVPARWTLSTDGLTLTGRIDVLPPVPNVLTAQLWPGLSDAAGNRVVDAAWSWAIPTWQDLGSPLWYRDTVQVSHGHIAALDAAGAPWVVAAETSSQQNYCALRLFRWTGSAWAEVMPWQTSNQRVGAVLDADADGTIAMAWLEMQPAGLLVVAAAWNGTAWTPPTVLNVNPAAQARGASVWASPGGRMVVGWSEDNVPMYAAWDGAAWKAVTGLPAQITRASITSSGAVSAYWTEGGYVVLSRGAGAVTGNPTPARGMMVYSPEGRPYEAVGGQLQVRRWAPPDHWEALGGVLNLVSGSDITPMDVRFAGEAPVVMWKEGGVVMKQWAGVWLPLVHAVDEATAPAANVYSPAGFVATTWTELIGRDKETALRVKRFNR